MKWCYKVRNTVIISLLGYTTHIIIFNKKKLKYSNKQAAMSRLFIIIIAINFARLQQKYITRKIWIMEHKVLQKQK